MFATEPQPYTPPRTHLALLQKETWLFYKKRHGSFTQRDMALDRGGVEATDAFVLTYYRPTTLPSLSPSKSRISKSLRCCANWVPKSSGMKSRRVGRRRGGGKVRVREEEEWSQHTVTHFNTARHTRECEEAV